jgi:hypothetical protein
MSLWTLVIARRVHVRSDSECYTPTSEAFRFNVVHKNLLQFPAPSQTNLIHNLPTCFFKIHFNTGLSSASRASRWILSFRYSYRIFALLSKHYCDDHTKKDEIGSHEYNQGEKCIHEVQAVPLNERTKNK